MRRRDEPEPGPPLAAEQPPSSTPIAGQAKTAQSTSFEAGLERLARIVDQLEAGELGLVESIDAYEQGIVLIRQLHHQLSACEQRVELLAAAAPPARGDSGLASVPDPSATAGRPAKPDRSATGTTGRAARTRRLPGMDDSPPGV